MNHQRGSFAGLSGPLEATTFPETLSARVVTPGTRPRIHGYDVESDLAVHYGATERLFLSLTGELPTSDAATLLEIALAFLAPVSVAHASTHSAVLARLCGATTSTTIGTAAIGLGEQARVLLDEHEALLAWLEKPTDTLPARYRTSNAAERASVERFATALAQNGVSLPSLRFEPTRSAALLCALHAAGLTHREQLEAAIVVSRLPTTLAEAFRETVANFRTYPTNLPLFQ
ncbi:MAG TPA: hypothetical protein VFZ53_10915, partial [Polyangiaceae bacterium]